MPAARASPPAAFVAASTLGMALGPLLSLPLAALPDWQVGPLPINHIAVSLSGRRGVSGRAGSSERWLSSPLAAAHSSPRLPPSLSLCTGCGVGHGRCLAGLLPGRSRVVC